MFRRPGVGAGRRIGARAIGGNNLLAPGAPTISAAGGVSIGQALTIAAGTPVGNPIGTYLLYRDGVSAGAVVSGYTYVAADIAAAALTVRATNAIGTSVDSNALAWAGILSAFGSMLTCWDNEAGQTGSPVDAWVNQQTSAAANWTATLTTRPSTGRRINSLAAPDFDGTNDKMVSASSMTSFIVATKMYFSGVLLIDAITTNSAAYYFDEALFTDSGQNIWIAFKSDGLGGGSIGFGMGPTLTPVELPIPVGTPFWFECWHDGTNINLRVGTTAATPVACAPIGSRAGTGIIGARYDSLAFMNGLIGTLIVCNDDPSASVKADSRAYHAAKWGVTA